MTFRNELRQALDDDVPAYPPAGLRERVLQTALVHKRRPRKEMMVYRLRVPLALVAAVLAVAVGVAAVITWNSLHQSNLSPAGHGLTSVQQLEARPLHLPAVSAGASCPQHFGTNVFGFDYGDGPVYANGGPVMTTQWGHLYDVTLFAQASLRGPVLVRGKDLQSSRPVAFVTSSTNGAVVGHDATQSPPELRDEMVFDPAKSPVRVTTQSGTTRFAEFPVRQGIAMGWQGCFGMQIDGPTFSEVIYGYDPSWTAS